MRTITVRAEAGLALDALLASEFGPVQGRALVAGTLDLNPGLADRGRVIPFGTAVMLPDAPPRTQAIRPVVSLFG